MTSAHIHKDIDEAATAALLGQVANEFIARLRRGEQPDIEQYAQQHPEIAPVLRQVLPALLVMHSGSAELSAEAGLPATQSAGPVALGDFRILREIGRGGMGIVYEAEQLSLDRHVALKVLPFAAMLDTKKLQRFKNEAHAAAQLHHQHIVPVYSVGCARGVHYYAMQYIEGQTLAAVIRDLRQLSGLDTAGPSPESKGDAAQHAGPNAPGALANELSAGRWAPAKPSAAAAQPTGPYVPSPADAEPVQATVRTTDDTAASPIAAISTEHSTRSPAFFRTVASLGVQTAEALEHAHQMGVVHRDIKPSNLLLDARGNIWVTDFGLARFETDPELTITGDLIGTVRYMSPEQALAKRITVDHRTDIYSLGVTLYEVLTLQPAFDGRDREELLRQIAFDDPRPLRRVNRAIPIELETIVLKATAKNPASRYATAQELADDLRRFLEDKPIAAKRPTLVDRVRKWSRRHVAVVRSATVLLLMGVVALAVSTVLIARQRDEAQRQRARAEVILGEARKAVDEYFTLVSESKLFDVPGLQPLRRDLLEAALKYYQVLVEQAADDPTLQHELALSRGRVGIILQTIGSQSDAAAAFQQACDLFEKLAEADPGDTELQVDLARTHSNLANAQSALGRLPEAEQSYHRARDIQEQLVQADPSQQKFQIEFSRTYHNMGVLHETAGRLADAANSYNQSRRILEKLVEAGSAKPQVETELARAYGGLANVHLANGETAEATDAYERARQIQERLVAAGGPAGMSSQSDLAETYNNFANLLNGIGKPVEAAELYWQAHEVLERLVQANPTVTQFQSTLAHVCRNLASLPGKTGQAAEGLRLLQRARDLLEQLIRTDPNVPEWKELLAKTYLELGAIHEGSDRMPESLAFYQHATEIAEKLIEERPGVSRYQTLLAGIYHNVGKLHRDTGHPDEAIRASERSRALQEKVLQDTTPTVRTLADLAQTYNILGLAQQDLRQNTQALESLQRARDIQQKLVTDRPDAPEYQRDLAQTYIHLGNVQDTIREPDEAMLSYQQAIAILERLAALRPTETDFQRGLASALTNMGVLQRRMGHVAEALGSYEHAQVLLQKLVQENAGNLSFLHLLGSNLNNMGRTLRDAGRDDEAMVAIQQAIEHGRATFAAAPERALYRQSLSKRYFSLGELQRKLGRAADAAATALERKKLWPGNPVELYDVACEMALCVPLVAKDKTELTEDEQSERQRYADQAVQALRESVTAGFKDFKHMELDKDLDPIRDHPRFREIVGNLR